MRDHVVAVDLRLDRDAVGQRYLDVKHKTLQSSGQISMPSTDFGKKVTDLNEAEELKDRIIAKLYWPCSLKDKPAFLLQCSILPFIFKMCYNIR